MDSKQKLIFLSTLTGMLSQAIDEMLIEVKKVDSQEIAKNLSRAKKLIIKSRVFGIHTNQVSEISTLFRDIILKLRQYNNIPNIEEITKEADVTLKNILDLSGKDEYILLLTALYITKNTPKEDIGLIHMQRKAERLYDEAVEIFNKEYDRKVITTSGKIAKTILDYIIDNKKIPYSIKSSSPNWSKNH